MLAGIFLGSRVRVFPLYEIGRYSCLGASIHGGKKKMKRERERETTRSLRRSKCGMPCVNGTSYCPASYKCTASGEPPGAASISFDVRCFFLSSFIFLFFFSSLRPRAEEERRATRGRREWFELKFLRSGAESKKKNRPIERKVNLFPRTSRKLQI